MSNAKQVPLSAFNKVFNLNKLILEAANADSLKELIFFILNHSIEFCSYKRAVMWSAGPKPGILGVSGNSTADELTVLKKGAAACVAQLSDQSSFQILCTDSFKDEGALWKSYCEEHNESVILWCPIIKGGNVLAGLWLERKIDEQWLDADINLLKSLCSGYAIGWSQFSRDRVSLLDVIKKKRITVFCFIVAVLCGIFIQLPLRIVAPCEIVPKDPHVVSAPLNGVIDLVGVKPGMSVKSSQLLFSYDKRIAVEQLKVSRQQVNIIRADLERTRARAFTDSKAKGSIVLLENKLKQERVKLRLAEYRAGKLDVRSGVNGVAMISDPNNWIGRPVAVGEKVLQIIDPKKSKLKIWLPQDDRIDFDPDQSVRIVLNTESSRTRTAKLVYIAHHASMSPDGKSAFLAEADWWELNDAPQVGVKGTAILYGKRVSLWFWLLRKPLVSLRQSLGL